MKRAWSTIGLGGILLTAVGYGSRSEAESRDNVAQVRAPIVGGIADLNHRYVVSLNGCSGTLISKYTVLTAGHCYGSVSSVRFGNTSGSPTKTIQVASKVRDPLYAEICDQDATYDLTVVKLMEPATAQPAPLLRMTLDNTPKYMGPAWVWVGFGLTMQGGSTGTKRVTTFAMDLVGPAPGRGSLCDIPDTLIYATSKNGRNACNGDSGGPSFFVYGGVEYLGGVTSSGDNACTLDDTQQRSDLPHIMRFIQGEIDKNEGTDPCRSNGVCDETCNTNGQVMDPDCQAAHCGADGLCAEACVAPRDPDCATVDADNCGDNGVCDLKCTNDPDCVRDCAAEGNCIPNCPTPDPDCAGQDGGTTTPDAGPTDGGGGGTTDVAAPDVARPDATPPPGDGSVVDATTPPPDATTPPRDATIPPTTDSGGTRDANVTRDSTTADGTTTIDSGGNAGAGGSAGSADSGSKGGSAGIGGGGSGGTGGSDVPPPDPHEDCSCRTVAAHDGTSRAGWLGVALGAALLRRRTRRRDAK
ncbi:MAG: trypsin-like serine protease [Polyangiaceae bacterium]